MILFFVFTLLLSSKMFGGTVSIGLYTANVIFKVQDDDLPPVEDETPAAPIDGWAPCAAVLAIGYTAYWMYSSRRFK